MDPNAEPSGIEKHTVTAGEAKKTLVAGEPALPPKAITCDQLPVQEDEATTGFMRRVFNAQIRMKLASKKPYLFDLPTGIRVHITAPGVKAGLELHKNIEPKFSKMFIAITADLQDPNCKTNEGRTDVHSIGVASAYRTLKQDKDAWVAAFHTHMKASEDERSGSAGGPLGEEAFHIMLKRMNSKKAPPGFSNHTRGVAVDFCTSQYFADYALDRKTGKKKSGVVALGPSSSQKPLWRKSWLYKWLCANAEDDHGFAQLKTEEWHWDHAE